MKTTEVSNFIKGWDALDALVSVALGERDRRIVQHSTGIDIDNASQPYDHENVEDYEHVLWSAMQYVTSIPTLKDGYTVDDLFSAEVIQGETFGNTDTKVLWFSINEDIFDSESRGTHFQFFYPVTDYVNAEDLWVGMDIDRSDDTDGEREWTRIEFRWQGTTKVWFEFSDGSVAVYNPNDRVLVRTWK